MKKVGEHPARSMGFLSRYHDGELSRAEKEAFERHVSECPECSDAAAEYEAVLAMYRESGVEAPDPALAGRISRRIDTELRHRPPVGFASFRIDLVWASVIAIALVAAVALFAVLGRREPGRAPVVVAERESSASAPLPAKPPPAAAPEPTPKSLPPAGGTVGRRAGREENRPAFAPENPRDRAAGGQVAGVEGGVEGGVPADTAPATPAPAPASEFAAPAAPRAKASADSDETPLRVGGAVSAPVLVKRIEPVIPASARRLLSASPVVVEAVISPDGDVVSTRIVRSNPAADRAVVEALRQWKYRPATLGGRPVPVYLTVTVRGE
ncbi:MAG TPA: TonB family protein [Thermoanaerobaculia bacterium]|nr:TonB family protein [Thermoanaerobaculia bacterium]